MAFFDFMKKKSDREIADVWFLVRGHEQLPVERVMLVTFLLTAKKSGWRNSKLFRCDGDPNKDPDYLYLASCDFSDVEAIALHAAIKSQIVHDFSSSPSEPERKIKHTLSFIGKGAFGFRSVDQKLVEAKETFIVSSPIPLTTHNGVGAKDITLNNFDSEVIAGSKLKPVLIVFWAEWWHSMTEFFTLLENHPAVQSGQVKLLKIDTEAETKIVEAFAIKQVPTCIWIFNGNPVDGFIGAISEKKLTEFFKKHLP